MRVNEVVGAFHEIIKRSSDENVSEFPSDNLIFRGQANSVWGLVPKLWRNEYNKNSEDDLITKYKRRYMVAGDDIFQNLTDMQHYGMPTRLLDWTKNFLIALYFAVEKDDNVDGKVFILDHQNLLPHNYIDVMRNLNQITYPNFTASQEGQTITKIKKLLEQLIPNEEEDSLSNLFPSPSDNNEIQQILNRLLNADGSNADSINSLLKLEEKYKQELCNILIKAIFFEPANLNPRIIAQSSVFTAHFGSGNSFIPSMDIKPFDWNELLPQQGFNENQYGINIAAIIIPRQWKPVIRSELKQYFGLHQAIVYPDDKEKVLAQYIEYSPQESNIEGSGSLKTMVTMSWVI